MTNFKLHLNESYSHSFLLVHYHIQGPTRIVGLFGLVAISFSYKWFPSFNGFNSFYENINELLKILQHSLYISCITWCTLSLAHIYNISSLLSREKVFNTSLSQGVLFTKCHMLIHPNTMELLKERMVLFFLLLVL